MAKILLALVGLFWAGPAFACPGVGQPCQIDNGSYSIILPKPVAGVSKPPIMLFLHGWGQTSKTVLSAGYTKTFAGHGFAVIAPQGLPGYGGNSDWSVEDGQPHPRDDGAFVRAVLRDAAKRFDLDRDDVLLAGFSRGASMVWNIACRSPDTARAYAPVAGGFWAPFPAECAGPVRMLHTHGFSDTTVPLEGRRMGHSEVAQSDIFAGLQLWRRVDGCGSRAGMTDVAGPLWRKIWTDCKAGTLEFALHAGSHGVPEGWADMAITWFDDLPPGPVDQQG